ncbi:MAG: MATE family efflux transporter [Clostridia bacterium]|nr:MATE family efflux transporter [Clostridia bacterium]
MFRRRTVDMLQGPIVKGLLALTMPIMVMNVLQTLFNVIDMWALGQFVNDKAVGAVGACGTLITLCTGLLTGISTGANVIVAKHIGEGDREKTDRATGTSLLFSVVGGLVLMIIGLVFAETFLRWTNCPESLMPQAVIYFRIFFLGVPVLLLYNFGASVLRATGDTKRPLMFSLIGGVTKVVLTVGCIVIFHWDVEGVAVATIISNALAAGLSYFVIAKGNDKTYVSLKTLKFYAEELKAILYVGIPTGLQLALYSFANVIITATVNSFGADATTGISIANQFDGILYTISCAPSLATIPYVAQNIGAGNIKRARQTVTRSIFITVVFGATFGSLSAIFSGQLSATMSSTPAVIQYSQQKMIIISSTYFICGINEIMGGALKGMGKPIIPTVATLLFMCAIRFVWVYGIFPLCPNLTFLYLIWPIGWILSIAMLLIAYFPTMRKLQKQFTPQEIPLENYKKRLA